MGESITGGCLCEGVRFEIDGPPTEMSECHCRDCQRAYGGGPAYFLCFRNSDFRLVRGVPKAFTIRADSGREVTRFFCSNCGTPAYGTAYGEMCFINAGVLDDPSIYRSEAVLWTRSAQPWHHLPDDVPAFDKESTS